MGVGRELYRALDTVGNGTGTKNAVGDYSSTETHFNITDPNQHFYITRLLVHIEDTGSFTTAGYGAISAGTITNGIKIHIQDPALNELIDLTDGLPITSNNAWGRVCYDIKLENWASGNGAIHARWTFTNAGHPLRIDKGHHFAAVLNDDFTGLVSQYFFVEGFTKAPL